ncbi:YlzJ-like family protein [Desertibacillus haloalkaliphilus]|uniref:YlzJ-like family protein n=1 Tax=Desertibacillus haloalkaliphilus TaxID=1328930 RepID=UPI001C271E50|nr:YlzJ-like family protein [Desertibacillus haloalkaliphilus]MBU8907355.1 YlzJ-like family protein [Desertibacillus haloalkaliphilus]
MILYTMMPEELIFPHDHESFNKQKTLEVEGGLLVVEQVNPNEYQVVRLISSDPAQYMNQKYSPGNVINVGPQLS